MTSRIGAAGIRVGIMGTKQSAVTDDRGRFVIDQSPVGKTRLQLAGAGVNATLAIPDLHAGKMMTLAIEVNGVDANLQCALEVDEPDGNNNDGQHSVGDGNACDQGDQNDGPHEN